MLTAPVSFGVACQEKHPQITAAKFRGLSNAAIHPVQAQSFESVGNLNGS